MRAELPVLSFISALSLLILIPFCLKSRNLPFISLVAWLLLCNIIQGVNTVVWANNASFNALGWCDIGTPLFPRRISTLIDYHSNSNNTRCTSGFAGNNNMFMSATRDDIFVLGYLARFTLKIPDARLSSWHVFIPSRSIYTFT